MKTTIYDTESLPHGGHWDDLRAIALQAMADGDYTTGYGLNAGGSGWETYSEPGDAFLEVQGGYASMCAMFAHNDVLRIIVTERTNG